MACEKEDTSKLSDLTIKMEEDLAEGLWMELVKLH